MPEWRIQAENGNERSVSSRAEAERVKAEMEGLGMTCEIVPPQTDGGVEVVESEAIEEHTEPALAELGESLDTDPLDVLPGYMITQVDGKPSLNKRGVSVLAYHFDISVLDREVVAYPHENEFTTAVVEITVKDGDGREYVGIGESHVDETDKHQLLRMAETRAYKRAVIFATGTGIVGYQELMGELK